MIKDITHSIPSLSFLRTLFVFTCAFSLFLLSFSFTEAATLSVSPQTGVYTVGGIFTTNIRINTQGKPINAAEATVSFDPRKVSVISLAKGSIFNLWTVDPIYSNAAGSITFGGGSPSGYTGSAGSVVSVTFRALTAGDTKVSFTSGSILAADGLGTNVLSSMGSAAFTLVANDVPAIPEVIEYVAPANTPAAPKVTSSTHTNPGSWYKNINAELSWSLPARVTAVRTLLDSNAGSIPTKVYETPISSISIPDLDEGVSYFHIQFKNSDGWGRVTHYRLAVDTQKPTVFDIALASDSDLSSPEQTLELTVTDAPSGIGHYSVQVDGGEPYEFIDETGSSTITLPALDPGHHSVIMEAFDKAGNSLISTFSFNILAFDKPQFTEYPTRINSEVIPVIKGITRPDSEVTINVDQVSTADGVYAGPSQYNVRSDDAGTFIFIPDGRLVNGVYELTAIAIDTHGAKSDPSDTIRIAVQDPGYIMIGSLIVSVLSVLIPLLGLVVLLVLLVVFFFRRIRTISRVVVTETKEAQTVLEKEFTQLHAVLTSQKEALEESRKTKKLTKAEDTLIVSMKNAMEESRKRVAKEIDDVDNIIE
ncbi:MAG: hypothetical protein ACI9VM_000126 [Candidatus Azotimanducaceae bacterium]|jgi:hypothetical protein